MMVLGRHHNSVLLCFYVVQFLYDVTSDLSCSIASFNIRQLKQPKNNPCKTKHPGILCISYLVQHRQSTSHRNTSTRASSSWPAMSSTFASKYVPCPLFHPTPALTNSCPPASQSYWLRRLARRRIGRRRLRLQPAARRVGHHGPLLRGLPHAGKRGVAAARV